LQSIRRSLLAVALVGTAAFGTAGVLRVRADTVSSVSDTIEDVDSGIRLDFTFNGGAISESVADGWEYTITGTVRPGETISLAASGNGTTYTGRHFVNEDLEATLSIWFEGSDVDEMVTIPVGESGSLAASYIVPDDVLSVKGVATISNAWINPNGGGSRTLTVRVRLNVVAVDATTVSPTPAPATTEKPPCGPSGQAPSAGAGNAIVRFGDLHGEVNVRPNCEDDDAYIFAELSTPLRHDDRIKTFPRSGAILSFSDMSTFVMREDTIIVLDIANVRQTKIGMVAGNIWMNLQRMVQDGSMEVEMSQAVAGIKGTTFVASEVNGVSTIKVFEGTVEMRPNVGGPVMVSDGQRVSVTADGAGPVEPFDTAMELGQWDGTVREMTANAVASNDRGETGAGGSSTTGLLIGLALLLIGGAALVMVRARNGHNDQPNTPPTATLATVPTGPAGGTFTPPQVHDQAVPHGTFPPPRPS